MDRPDRPVLLPIWRSHIGGLPVDFGNEHIGDTITDFPEWWATEFYGIAKVIDDIEIAGSIHTNLVATIRKFTAQAIPTLVQSPVCGLMKMSSGAVRVEGNKGVPRLIFNDPWKTAQDNMLSVRRAENDVTYIMPAATNPIPWGSWIPRQNPMNKE